MADTPGLPAGDGAGRVHSERNLVAFPEVERYFGQCKFTGCSHTVEKGCAVRAALEAGEIDKTRYESYVTLYNEAKEVKEWQM
ncbi:MAG: hypothetical protein ACLR7U_07335 [Ruthenibacterium lactatiformans]